MTGFIMNNLFSVRYGPRPKKQLYNWGRMCSLWGRRRGWRNSWASSVVFNYDGVICEVRNQVKETLWLRASNVIFSKSQVSTFKSYRLRFPSNAITRSWSTSYLLVMYLEIIVVSKYSTFFCKLFTNSAGRENYRDMRTFSNLLFLSSSRINKEIYSALSYKRKSPLSFTVTRRRKLQIGEVLGNIVLRM